MHFLADRQKDVTVLIVCDHRLGADLVNHPGEVSADTADLTTTKCLINNNTSTKDARMACFDIKNFHLKTPMERPECVNIPLHLIPQATINHCQLTKIAQNGCVHC